MPIKARDKTVSAKGYAISFELISHCLHLTRGEGYRKKAILTLHCFPLAAQLQLPLIYYSVFIYRNNNKKATAIIMLIRQHPDSREEKVCTFTQRTMLLLMRKSQLNIILACFIVGVHFCFIVGFIFYFD